MLKEFKTFIMRGNVVDLAVAVIIGATFGAIVNSLVADVITPLLLKPTMESLGVEKLEGLAWNGVLYGKFLATVINFIGTWADLSRYVNGMIADPFVYSRVLSLPEIRQLANPANYMLSGLIRPIGSESNIYDREGIR